MYVNIGSNKMIRENEIVGIFDLDSTTISKRTRNMLNKAEKNGKIEVITYDLPKSFIVVGNKKKNKIYLSQLSTNTLYKRILENKIEKGEEK